MRGWKNRPDRKGIKTTIRTISLIMLFVGKTDPIERGLRLWFSLQDEAKVVVGKTDPIERGLRLVWVEYPFLWAGWKNRPDRKGIKTPLRCEEWAAASWKNRPDRKGIKTNIGDRIN